jgi:hypothetical protein
MDAATPSCDILALRTMTVPEPADQGATDPTGRYVSLSEPHPGARHRRQLAGSCGRCMSTSSLRACRNGLPRVPA